MVNFNSCTASGLLLFSTAKLTDFLPCVPWFFPQIKSVTPCGRHAQSTPIHMPTEQTKPRRSQSFYFVTSPRTNHTFYDPFPIFVPSPPQTNKPLETPSIILTVSIGTRETSTIFSLPSQFVTNALWKEAISNKCLFKPPYPKTRYMSFDPKRMHPHSPSRLLKTK